MSHFTSPFKDNKNYTTSLGRFCKTRGGDGSTVQGFLDHALLQVTPAPIGNGNFTPLRDLLTKTAGIGAIRSGAIEAYALAHVPNMKWKTDKNGDRTLCKKDKDQAIVVASPAVDDDGIRIEWTAFKRDVEASGLRNVSDEAIAKRMEGLNEKISLTVGDKAIEILASHVKSFETQLEAVARAHNALVLEANMERTDTDEDSPSATEESEAA